MTDAQKAQLFSNSLLLSRQYTGLYGVSNQSLKLNKPKPTENCQTRKFSLCRSTAAVHCI